MTTPQSHPLDFRSTLVAPSGRETAVAGAASSVPAQRKEPQVFELKVLRDFGLNENQNDDPVGAFNVRDRRDFNNFDDEFGGLDMLKLEDGFSQINQSTFLAMQ